MNGNVLFDTNVITKMLDNDTQAKNLFKQARFCFTSIIVVGELYYAAVNSGKPKENFELFRNFLSHMKIIPLNDAIAFAFAELKLSLKKIGKPIPENDIWIAASAKTYSLSIATFDKHFTEISDIDIVTVS